MHSSVDSVQLLIFKSTGHTAEQLNSKTQIPVIIANATKH